MEQIVFNRKLANIGINAVIRHRFAWLTFILAVVVLCGLGLKELRLDISNESFLPESDELVVATGMPVGDFEIDQLTAREGSEIGLIALATAYLFILLLFRNPVGAVAPLLVMLGTILILFGGMGWLGVPVSIGSVFVAPLLMALSVSYSIHYIGHFNFYFRHKGERLRALHYAYGQSAWPCFLTAATTAIGFASLLIVSLKPIRDVGIACGTGTLVSFILVMILVPIFYSFGKETRTQNTEHSQPKRIFPWGMVPLARFVMTVKLPAIAIALGCCVFGFFYGLRIPVETDLMKLLMIGQLESIAIALAVIGLVMVVILKSVRAGLISMIPNIIPVLVIAGLMGLLQIRPDIMAIMIAPMVIAISVDDTVHFFIHFKSELSGFRDYQKANRQTFIKIGHAVIFTSAVLTVGFGILGFSQVSGIVGMGFLAVVGVISALAANIFITPVLLVYLKPFGKLASKRNSAEIPESL